MRIGAHNGPQTQRSYSPDHLPFLTPSSVRQACQHLEMGTETVDACLDNLHLFQNPDPRIREALLRLAWHFHVLWFAPLSPDEAALPHLPTEKLGQSAAMFYVYIFLSGIPYIEKLHRRHNVPEAITLDTLSDIERWMRKYREINGYWGFNQAEWMRRHFRQRLYKLGRLQFEMTPFPFDLHAYRNRRTRQVILLAGEGGRCRSDGLFAVEPEREDWISQFREERAGTAAGIIRGTPISPLGHAERRCVELASAEWEEILRKDDPALNVHIPAAGPMDHEECGKSFEWARRFFPEHHPEYKFRAFECFSWLLEPRFEQHLEPHSNIIRFLREWYLIPVPKWGDIQEYGHIFDHWKGELDQAPQRTSLQRATYKLLKSGGRWRVGGALIFPEDLDWGSEVYRKNYV